MFSATFRYGLICLLELAGRDELIQAGSIAARHQLSPHYLAVVLAELRRLGLVQSHKGKKGGYRLLRPPGEVNLLGLYQALAGSAQAPGSPTTEGVASPQGHGGRGAEAWMQDVWQRWSAELAATTLADLQAWQARDPESSSA